MTRVININSIAETTLWEKLNKKGGEAKVLSENLKSLSEEAIDRMKIMATYAPQYTLHDDRHLLRVTELMALILGSESNKLNNVEITLLILSALFHDQGMILNKQEIKNIESNDDFLLFRENWLLEHPNYRETESQINTSYSSKIVKKKYIKKLKELDACIIIDYIRELHGDRAYDYIISTYRDDKRFEIQGVNVAPILAKICKSHTLPGKSLTPENGFRYDEQVGTYEINMPFIATVLRLADILDFDRDRTPDILLKSIHFTSPVSLREWEKHRSVQGWQISSDLIRYTAKCKHPSYESAIRLYMDWIDNEIINCKQICNQQPRNIEGYQLYLPSKVDRSRIEPLDDAYKYHDLEFNLSRDEIVRLLMTDKLYGREHLCIRELLQNSLDALRYRNALFSSANTEWKDGKVEFRHYINEEGYEVLECTDNGTGMDEDIIRDHFIKIGRSYYRSPFFERERNRLKTTGDDFDPCSQFGIGFMSCFMIGDRITIYTRKDYGPNNGHGKPLIIEINGLSGLLVVKEGKPNQEIGTRVSIIGRKKPSFIDSWTDRIQLCQVLKGYAIATEYPIIGKCDVPEIKESVTIPTNPDKTPTLIEIAEIKESKTIQQDLNEVSPSLRGFARASFLLDNSKVPTLKNSAARWIGKKVGSRKKWYLELLPKDRTLDYEYLDWSVPVSIDGILVGGTPGRASYRDEVKMRLGSRNSFIYSNVPALIDARGDLKPEITPGRVPPDMLVGRLPAGWKRLNDNFKKGLGLLWENLVEYLSEGLSPETFWKLVIIHEISVGWIPFPTLWKNLPVMVGDNDQGYDWCLIRELGQIKFDASTTETQCLINSKGFKIGPNNDLINWENIGSENPSLDWQMFSIVLLMSSLDVQEDNLMLEPTNISNSSESIFQYTNSSILGVRMLQINYSGDASDFLSVEAPFPTVNRSHPLVKQFHKSRHEPQPNEFQQFIKSFIPCITEVLCPNRKDVSLENPGYWQKRVGHLFFSVNWSNYDESLRPPYLLWTKGNQLFSFGENDFKKWRDSKAIQ